MYNIWFCKIMDEDKDGYLTLSYEKLIYENLKKEEIEKHCKDLDKEWDDKFIFDRIDHEQYVRFKNNNNYCLFIEELLDENKINNKNENVSYLQNLYNMLREFDYEKNGLENTIDFLGYMIEELQFVKNVL